MKPWFFSFPHQSFDLFANDIVFSAGQLGQFVPPVEMCPNLLCMGQIGDGTIGFFFLIFNKLRDQELASDP